MITEHGERALQMLCIQDQEPIQTFGSSGLNEPLRDPIRLGYLNWRPNDSNVLSLEHGIEAAHKLTIVVANQKPNRFCAFGERPGHLPRLLRHPFQCSGGRARARWTRRLETSMKNRTYNR